MTINGKDEVELAYALMPEYWGRGIATEVALTLIEVAFVRLRLPSVVIYTLPDNEASRRVAEKAGFRLEGSADIDGLRHVVYRRHAPLPLRGRS